MWSGTGTSNNFVNFINVSDNGHSFDSVLFYGNERTLFMFNLYTFIFVDVLLHNFVLAGIITFVVDLVSI